MSFSIIRDILNLINGLISLTPYLLQVPYKSQITFEKGLGSQFAVSHFDPIHGSDEYSPVGQFQSNKSSHIFAYKMPIHAKLPQQGSRCMQASLDLNRGEKGLE